MSEVRNMVQETAKEATDSAAAGEEISATLDEIKDIAAQSVELAKYIEKQVNQFKIGNLRKPLATLENCDKCPLFSS